ncbi:MAG: phosphatidylglycerophosphatase A [Acidimicrobiia bacterium]|jgi:phosphatidylglycerophosphatase A
MRRLLASWFGTGLILGRLRGSHLGSGTVGALFALPIALLVGSWLGWQGQIAATAVVVFLSLWSADRFVADEGDAGWIVVDEAAGTFVAVIGLPIWPALLAWVVFRVADIEKDHAPGVAAAERLPGSTGVTADDVVAGLYGLVIGHLAWALL